MNFEDLARTFHYEINRCGSYDRERRDGLRHDGCL